MKRPVKVFLLAIYISTGIVLCGAGVLYFGKMDKTIKGSGIVYPKHKIEVPSRIGGIIKKVFVKEGQSVSAGDTLFTLESDAIKLEVEKAENAIADATADLKRAKDEYQTLNASRAYELGTILADLNEAEKRKNYYKKRFERAGDLYKKGLLDSESFEDEKLKYESSVSYYNVLKRKIKVLKNRLRYRIERAERDLTLAEKTLALAKDKLDKTIITAPISGTILTAEPEKLEGTMVKQGESVITLGCFDEYVFKVDIDESNIINVKPGQRVKIFLNSFPHREYKVFEGRVEKIAPSPIFRSGKSMFNIDIEIEEPWVEDENGEKVFIKYGLKGRAEIIVKPNVRLYKLLIDALSK